MDISTQATSLTPPLQATNSDQVQPESELDAENLAPIKTPDGVPSISPEKYEELVRYFKYASSSYTLICPRPCGNTLVTSFSNVATDILGFIVRDSARKEIIVATRGSASIADVILDAQVVQVPLVAPGVKVLSEVRVHAGFLAAWDSVALQVLTVLLAQHKIYPDYSFVTTGHSLGGAVALLAALSLKGTFPSRYVAPFAVILELRGH
ncbi:hypothetical protein EST38_g6488 [Candolleomyces aberdarensis]|uniref:Fungal lipase-type domain-containing protein n=1 Tax=Candolleomyces aberdarensis TaxID=2316362 RepID=A0A4Q2DKV3_9AGAR|nr:hypothetical protein EST38_g6488 [Candolleomyces aberdarensis]